MGGSREGRERTAENAKTTKKMNHGEHGAIVERDKRSVFSVVIFLF